MPRGSKNPKPYSTQRIQSKGLPSWVWDRASKLVLRPIGTRWRSSEALMGCIEAIEQELGTDDRRWIENWGMIIHENQQALVCESRELSWPIELHQLTVPMELAYQLNARLYALPPEKADDPESVRLMFKRNEKSLLSDWY